MATTNEAHARVSIDAQLKDLGWNVHDPNSVRYEATLPDGSRADYVLCDRYGRSLAVIEAKKASINPAEASRSKGWKSRVSGRMSTSARPSVGLAERRETIVPSLYPGMARWREILFAFMALNATSATKFFNIPTERVVELGTQLEI